jgi:hypothetical protein
MAEALDMSEAAPEGNGMRIWVDMDVWHRLRRLSRNAESPNALLRRAILDQVPDGFITPRQAYKLPLLQALIELGGSAEADVAQERLEEVMRDTLVPIDYEPYQPDGAEIRWRNCARFARNALVKSKHLVGTSPHGIWEISEMGRVAVKAGCIE